MFSKSLKSSKVFSMLCVLCMIVSIFENSLIVGGAATPATAENAIEISSAAELQRIGNDAGYPLAGDYVLTKDIDMSGINFTPIGGGTGTRGSDSGNNVFSGTFDGQGHVISNLTINKTVSSGGDWQIGLFGIISSNTTSKYAEVKNLILTDINIKADISGGYLSLGGLAGEINHNAVIDNIAVFNGSISGNPNNRGDVVGVGGLTGEIRYDSTVTDNGVTISNIYNGADISSGSSTSSNYVAGLIGRIAYTNCKSVNACVNTGTTSFKDSLGYGISAGSMRSNISNCYYLTDTGYSNTGTPVSESSLKSSTLLTGLSDSYWSASGSSYMMLKQCTESETLADILALVSLYPVFADGDTISGVTKNFQLPVTINAAGTEETVTWQSSNTDVISISGSNATVHNVFADTECTLTAETTSGRYKSITVTVLSSVAVKIEQEYGVVGVPLTAAMVNAPADISCTYRWDVNGTLVSETNSYTPKASDLEKTITVTATGTGEYIKSFKASMYFSKLPVFYVNTEGGKGITDKVNYINSNLKIQGNETFNSSTTTLYDGGIGIRGRGNTTWNYPKKPYKIKLDTKANLFGYGSNKHWVLLANYLDESHMRNMLSYNLSGSMGMPYMKSASVILILNGEYVGTYQFCQQIRIDESRVNIHDWENYAEDVAKAIYKAEQNNGMTTDDRDALEIQMAENDLNWITTGEVTYKGKTYTISNYMGKMPEATGGVLLELDSYYDEVSKFRSSRNQPLQFSKPEFIYTNPTFVSFVQNYINAFESAISSYDYTTVYNGETKSYSQLFDMDSLARFWMISELFMNVDAMKKSTYMYKDIDGLFHMGPIWDMDWSSDSLVSAGQGSGSYSEWQTVKFSDADQARQWYKLIIKDPYFAVQAYEVYQAYRENMLNMVKTNGIIDTYKVFIQEAADVNASKWYGGDGNKSLNTQVNRLKTFLNNRINWLDSKFTSPEVLLNSLGVYSTGGGISVESNGVSETDDGVMIRADVTNGSVAKVKFCVNGENVGIETVTGGAASIHVPDSKLVKKRGALNTVQVFGLTNSGSIVTVSSRNVTDYTTFLKDVSVELTGTVTIQGKAVVGSKLQAVLTNSNATGNLAYQWFANDVAIPGADGQSYTLTANETGKQISVVITSDVESGSLQSSKTNIVSEPVDAEYDEIAVFMYTRETANISQKSYPATEGTSKNGAKLEFYYADGTTQANIGRTQKDREPVNCPNNAARWIPASGEMNANNSAGWLITLNTTNYENIKFSANQGSSNNGPRDFKLAYRIGTTGDFVELSDSQPHMPVTTAADTIGKTFEDVSLPVQMEDQPVVQLKVYISSAESRGTGTFDPVGGNTSINNIVFTGTKMASDSIAFDSNIIITRPVYNEDSAKINVSATNNTENPLSFSYIVAIYEENEGKLTDIEVFNVNELGYGETDNEPLDISGMDLTGADTMKLFIFDLNDMKPLTPLSNLWSSVLD